MRWLSLFCALAAVAVTSAADSDAAKEHLRGLQGSWVVEKLEYNGNDFTNKFKLTFTFKDNVASIEGNDEVKKEYVKLVFKLDPGTTPKCVDLTVAGGVQDGAAMEGIYDLKKDELRLCVKVFGNERPLEFKSSDGSSIALLTLKRDK